MIKKPSKYIVEQISSKFSDPDEFVTQYNAFLMSRLKDKELYDWFNDLPEKDLDEASEYYLTKTKNNKFTRDLKSIKRKCGTKEQMEMFNHLLSTFAKIDIKHSLKSYCTTPGQRRMFNAILNHGLLKVNRFTRTFAKDEDSLKIADNYIRLVNSFKDEKSMLKKFDSIKNAGVYLIVGVCILNSKKFPGITLDYILNGAKDRGASEKLINSFNNAISNDEAVIESNNTPDEVADEEPVEAVDKDMERAMKCTSVAKAAAMVNAIKDVDKLLRRTKAFIEAWGLDDDRTYCFLTKVESMYTAGEITADQFEEAVGTTPEDYIANKQPEALRELNRKLRNIAEWQVKLYNARQIANDYSDNTSYAERSKAEKLSNNLEKRVTKEIALFKEWLETANAGGWVHDNNTGTRHYDPYFINHYPYYRTGGVEDQYYDTPAEWVPTGDLAKALKSKKDVVKKVLTKLEKLSNLHSIVKRGGSNARGSITEYVIDGNVPVTSKNIAKFGELQEKYGSAYPNTIIFNNRLTITIIPWKLATVDAIPTLPSKSFYTNYNDIYGFDEMTDSEKVSALIAALSVDTNKSADNFEELVENIIRDYSRAFKVGGHKPKVSKNWSLKSTKDLTEDDLMNFPALIYVDENAHGFDEQGVIKTLVCGNMSDKKSMITAGLGDITIGGHNCNYDDLITWNDAVINPFYAMKAGTKNLALVVKEALRMVGHEDLYSGKILKQVKDKAKMMMDWYREKGILKSFNMSPKDRKVFAELRNKCKTKLQRKAFNGLLKTFA